MLGRGGGRARDDPEAELSAAAAFFRFLLEKNHILQACYPGRPR